MPPLRSTRRAALRLLAGSAALALAACGRKGAPLPPYDVDPCYPRRYPMDEDAKQACAQKEEYAREHPPQPTPPKGQKKKSSATPSTEPAKPAQSSDQPQAEPATPTPPSDGKPQ
ncbi:MAG TPA: lipoprotein [Alphaproteobacteria bacterium]|nr:lipoprotein [Alphaproteobacteria bacterium]